MFPLLHFLLPPGEENRGKGLHRTKDEGNAADMCFSTAYR
jgi:hypothetical protein